MNAVHPLQTSSRRWLPLQPAEWALLVAAAALLAFAIGVSACQITGRALGVVDHGAIV